MGGLCERVEKSSWKCLTESLRKSGTLSKQEKKTLSEFTLQLELDMDIMQSIFGQYDSYIAKI